MKSRNTFNSAYVRLDSQVRRWLILMSLLIIPYSGYSEIDIDGGNEDFLESRLSMELQADLGGSMHSAALIRQKGNHNLASVSQSGETNIAEVLQYGSNNLAYIDQFGVNNRALVRQVGSDNYADVLQEGANNVAAVAQHGGRSFSLEQIGNNMKVNIVQN